MEPMMESHDTGAVASVRQAMRKSRKDELGFSTEDQTNLTTAQIKYLLTMASSGDIREAVKASGASADEIGVWLADLNFRAIYDEMLGNKREGAKLVGTQMLPLMMLSLQEIMLTGKNADKLAAMKLLATMQGLLIEGKKNVDKDTLRELLEDLRAPRPVTVYKELKNGQD